jgi:hypothetical protein
MRNKLALTVARKKQGGYALLLVVFLMALLVVSTMSIGLRILTEGRREREQEMIWRGKQYTRGVKLYYQKLGRFPNSMDDLVKPKIGSLRFMRQAYKDPMNKEDGSWRLIYVGPAGNLIGSLKPPQGGIQMPAAGGQAGAAPGSSFGSFGSQPAPTGGIAAPGSAAAGSAAGPGTGTGGTGTITGAQGTDTTGTGADSQAVPTGDLPTIVGGNIIGIGSKINHPSVMVYEKAHNYRRKIWASPLPRELQLELPLARAPRVRTQLVHQPILSTRRQALRQRRQLRLRIQRNNSLQSISGLQ